MDVMANDTIRFPMNSIDRIRNRRGKRSVSCTVSGRWLRFRDDVYRGPGETLVFIDVMTETDPDKESRKLCDLCISVEELKKVLSRCEPER